MRRRVIRCASDPPEQEDRDREIAPTEAWILSSCLNRILGWVKRRDRRVPFFRSTYRRAPT